MEIRCLSIPFHHFHPTTTRHSTISIHKGQILMPLRPILMLLKQILMPLKPILIPLKPTLIRRTFQVRKSIATVATLSIDRVNVAFSFADSPNTVPSIMQPNMPSMPQPPQKIAHHAAAAGWNDPPPVLFEKPIPPPQQVSENPLFL